MHATSAGQPWDFSHVYGLIDSLSHNDDRQSRLENKGEGPKTNGDYSDGVRKPAEYSQTDRKDFAAAGNGLGDFSRIYQYLGTPLSSPAPAVQRTDTEAKQEVVELLSKDDYASDGATYIKSLLGSNKNVTWDDSHSADDPATGDASDTSVVPDSPTLTKSQRKKRNRRARKAKEAAAAARAATVSESEADMLSSKKTPASKASAHVRSKAANARFGSATPTGSGSTTMPNQATNDEHVSASIQTAVARLEAAKKANAESRVAESDATPSKAPRPDGQFARTTSHPPAFAQSVGNPGQPVSQPSVTTKWPITPAQNKHQLAQLLPSTVRPPNKSAATPTQTPDKSKAEQRTAPAKFPRMIEPMLVRSGEDRHWALFMKLLGDFWADRAHLISPMNLTTHNNDPQGIHVFVDASNIFIGFNDQLKRSRGIPPYVQVPAVDLSFDALALLMERRRPVAKRVLAGSNPWLAAFDKAKAVGYECSILEKVYKARELTERQIFFREQDRLTGRGRAKAPPANTVATVNGSTNGNGSGSETNAPQYARPAMIEQGVDEILHLKILESIVDTETPATIVLATGDAAQAEYSQGFMAMAERALKKGWAVELVSWSKNISAMYTRRAWTEAWGERFKIVFLDDYAEELLAM